VYVTNGISGDITVIDSGPDSLTYNVAVSPDGSVASAAAISIV